MKKLGKAASFPFVKCYKDGSRFRSDPNSGPMFKCIKCRKDELRDEMRKKS
jgi:hypothetical protein